MAERSMDFVVLAWNSGAYIGPCVESVLALGGLCHRLYVVDNGSTDSTPGILAEASAADITRAEAWERVGLLDEAIFYAPEDVGWCLRCHEAGCRVVRVHGPALTHYYQRLSKKKLLSSVNWEHMKGLAHYFRGHGYLFRAPEFPVVSAAENASGGGRLGADDVWLLPRLVCMAASCRSSVPEPLPALALGGVA